MRLFLFIIALFAAEVNASVFRFLYIEASEGSSSGGHVALQLGDEVYHYQYDDGLIRLFKHNAESFQIDYQLKQNRTIHVADVEISEAAFNQLANHFKLVFFQQKQAINQMESARNDQALLAALLPHQEGKAINQQVSVLPLKLLGAGLFYDGLKTKTINASTTCRTENASLSILAEIRGQLESRYGKAFLAQKSQGLRRLIGSLLPPTSRQSGINHYAFSEQYADLLTGLLALKVIEQTKPLMANACFQVNRPELKLTDAAIHQAKAYQQAFINSARSLLTSTRPDWGYALLVTLARLIALEQSIQTGYWTFVDDSDDDSAVIVTQQLSLYGDYVPKQRTQSLRGLTKAASRFINNTTAYDKNYANLEMAANRYQQWLNSDQTGEIRYSGSTALPVKSIAAQHYLITDVPSYRLLGALRQKEKEEERLLEKKHNQEAYHLLLNNCVTALFVQINKAVNGQSKQLLGGFIDPKNTIIPFQAFAAVQDQYRVVNTSELLSYRQQKLAKLYRSEVDSWVYARESNVFSSSLYKHNPDDAWFVFFTDDALALRPLFGAINTVAAASQSLWGLFSWPFGGEIEDVKIGARGVLASLPELAFFNIRKGSYPYPFKAEINE